MIKFLKKKLKIVKKIIRPEFFAALPLEPVSIKPMANIVGGLINGLLAFVAGLAILMIIIGGIIYIKSWGNTEQMEKAKKIIVYAVIGLVIILVSYSAVVALDAIINE